jgi:predicted DNA-binding transcriptional regulator AlpA
MVKPTQDAIDRALFLDISDMAKALKCSPRHVTNLRNRREIPQPVKLGARVLSPRKRIEDWISDGCESLAV